MKLFKKHFIKVFIIFLLFVGVGIFTPFNLVRANNSETVTIPSTYSNCAPTTLTYTTDKYGYVLFDDINVSAIANSSITDECSINQIKLGVASSLTNAQNEIYDVLLFNQQMNGSSLSGGPSYFTQANGAGVQQAYFNFLRVENCNAGGNCGQIISGNATGQGQATSILYSLNYCVGDNCNSGGGGGGGGSGPDVTLSASANPNQVDSGGGSTISYSSSNAISCRITYLTNNSETIGQYCPTSGSFSTGPLYANSNPASDKEHRYKIDCGYGDPWVGTPTGLCSDSSGGGISFEKIEKNKFALENYYNQFKGFILKMIPEALAAPVYPSAEVIVSIWARLPTPELTVSLSKKAGEVKNVVRAGDQDSIGQIPLTVNIQNIPSNTTCTLKNLMKPNDPIIESYQSNGTYNTSAQDLIGGNNNFKINCFPTNNQNNTIAESSTVSAVGQTGTMSSPENCVIPLNGNSCTMSIPWTVTSPKGSNPTLIKAQIQGGTTLLEKYNSGATNTAGTASITLNGSDYMQSGSSSRALTFSIWNKVDGTNSSSSLDNGILYKPVNMVCASGNWDGYKCALAQAQLPDLIAGFTSPASAEVGTSVTLNSTITNQGNATTLYSFFNFFQYSTVNPDTGEPGNPDVTFKFFDLFSRKANAAEQTLFDLPAVSLNAIAPGGNRILSYQTTAFNSVGVYWVRACADKSNSNNSGTIPELNEYNNCGGWTTLNIYAGAMPDLIANAPSISGSSGTTRTLTSVITNMGTVSTGTSFPNFFQKSTVNPSLGTPPDNALTDLPPAQMGALGGGVSGSSFVSHNFVNPGTYWVRACADKANRNDINGVIPESNETNNCSNWTTLTISSGAMPDLVASAPSISGTSGTTRTLTTTILNQGTASTGIGFPNFFQKSTEDPILGTPRDGAFTDLPFIETQALGAGVSRNLSLSHNFGSSGKYWVRACADKANRNDSGVITESNENNNCSDWTTLTISSEAKPDLVASAPVVSGSSGTTRTLTTTILNQGTASTVNNFWNFFQKSTANPSLGTPPDNALTDLPPAQMQALGVGVSNNFSLSHDFVSSGTYWVRACADKANRSSSGTIPELDETNNCSDWTSVVIGNPPINGACSNPPIHYICASGTSTNQQGNNPDNYIWDCEGINGGADSRCYEPKDTNNMTGVLNPNEDSCAILAGGNSCDIGFSWSVQNPVSPETLVTKNPNITVATGHQGVNVDFDIKYNQETFYLYNNGQLLDEATVSSYCTSGTSWDDKKQSCTTITGPLPDLTAGAPIPTSEVAVGVERQYTSTITNIGDGGVTLLGGFYNLFQVSTEINGGGTITDYPANNNPMNPLGPKNDSADATVMITFGQMGTYGLRACADKEHMNDLGTVTESDEGNNCSSWVSVTVKGEAKEQPDLIVSNISPIEVSAGDRNSFYTTISNIGNASTNYRGINSFNNLFQVREESMPDIDEYVDAGVGNLAHSTSIPTSISLIFEKEGKYQIRACADKSSAKDTGVIEESNEDNNCGNWTTIMVLSADSPLPGICNPTHYRCDSGTSVDQREDESFHYWECQGSSGGRTERCVEPKGGGGGGGGEISINFDAKPIRILKGRKSTLTWQVSGADSCQITGGDYFKEIVEAGDFNSSDSVSPTTTTTYILSCVSGDDSTQEEVTVKVTDLFFIEI